MSQYVLYALWNSDADNLYSKARSNAIIVTCLNPKLRISITPESYGVKKNGTIKFTGVVQDEYGNPIEGNPTVKRTITYASRILWKIRGFNHIHNRRNL